MTCVYTIVLADLDKSEMMIYRWNLVQYAENHGISAAARFYSTSRKTVRKWLNAWKKGGREALVDGRHGPHIQPNKISSELETEIIAFRQRHPHLGARRIKIELKLQLSPKTIHRVLRDAGLVIKRRTRYRKRQDLRAIKQGLYAPGECWQNDIMYLTDVPSAVEILKRHPDAPSYLYTIRDVHSGAVFVGYAKERSEKHAECFINHMLKHCRRFGLSPENLIIQTDNGSEFSGARYVLWNREGYSHTVHVLHGAEHRFIPPGCSNANADIEAFHSLIQREFFDLSRFTSRDDLLYALAAYLLYFNTTRYCLSKDGRTPMQILEPRLGTTALQFLSLPPIDLDELVYRSQPGNHLTSLAII
jgi:transposase InsO family protein